MIGLVAEELLYLKVDEQTKPLFRDADCEPFIYQSKTKDVAMSYWSVPDEAMESSEQMLPWAKLAYAAALRKEKKATPKKKT
jgi:DNA transformation protein